jgi:uncharacterized protein (UPF0333 family)
VGAEVIARSRRGQATTEYFVLISVLVVGLVVAAYAFVPGFTQGMTALRSDATTLLTAGAQDGHGDRR